MKLTADYHIHTPYSHGKSSVLENALKAKELGLNTIGISDHGFNHMFFPLKRKNLSFLKEEIYTASQQTGVEILLGMESNLISLTGKSDMKDSDLENFDIYLCGLHLLVKYCSYMDLRKLMLNNYFTYKFRKTPSKELIVDTTKAFIELIKNNPVDILTHINFKCFCDLKTVAKVCADYGTYIEINTKKQHISAEELYEMSLTGVKFIINSDAHSSERVGDTLIAEQLLNQSGINSSLIDNIDGRIPNFRFREYKKLFNR